MGEIYNKQAIELNNKLNDTVMSLLSEKGKAIFFPKKGILAQTAQAKGKKIDATIGTALEDDGQPLCLECISEMISLDKKDAFNYAPSYGKPELREIWQKMLDWKNPSLSNNISTPIVTNAITNGLSICGYLFIDPGDELIIPDPYWGNYNLIFSNGFDAQIKKFPIFSKSRLNIEGLKKILKDNKENVKILFNFPNNPTGYSPSVSETNEIVKLIKQNAEDGKKILALIDDAYFGLFYENETYKESLFSRLHSLHENVLAVKLDGATKEDYVWGFRTGFITYGIKGGNKEIYSALEDKTAGALRGNISNANHISQSLLLKAYSDKSYKKQKLEKFEVLKKRYQKVRNLLSDKKYEEFFMALPFNSGYFMCIKLKNIDAEELRQRLLKEYDTGVIAVGNLIRIAFSATPYDKLEELFENIYDACKSIKNT
jgi:aspartate/methionine/tyrosine aminotransferase